MRFHCSINRDVLIVFWSTVMSGGLQFKNDEIISFHNALYTCSDVTHSYHVLKHNYMLYTQTHYAPLMTLL